MQGNNPHPGESGAASVGTAGRVGRRHRQLPLVEIKPNSLGPRDARRSLKIGVRLVLEFRRMVQEFLPQTFLVSNDEAHRTVCPVQRNQIAPC